MSGRIIKDDEYMSLVQRDDYVPAAVGFMYALNYSPTSLCPNCNTVNHGVEGTCKNCGCEGLAPLVGKVGDDCYYLELN